MPSSSSNVVELAWLDALCELYIFAVALSTWQIFKIFSSDPILLSFIHGIPSEIIYANNPLVSRFQTAN